MGRGRRVLLEPEHLCARIHQRHQSQGDRLLEDLPLISCVFSWLPSLSCVFVPSIVGKSGQNPLLILTIWEHRTAWLLSHSGRLLAGPSCVPAYRDSVVSPLPLGGMLLGVLSECQKGLEVPVVYILCQTEGRRTENSTGKTKQVGWPL